MSKYVSLILFISGMENEKDRIEEVNKFELSPGQLINLTDVNGSPFPDFFPRSIYCGTYRNIDLDKFLAYLKQNVAWKYPKVNSLIVQTEDDAGLTFYNLG